ncbi:PBP1 and LysM peptidoglycan-binding domain-containing protein [Marinifilum sp.]|uniref:PBP1 and LysM peptidoglycan-binding domain-containing protein n=1 Tax=Marinifilum sp. TaxID=2033137 RepID=UPI003BAADD1E
MNCFLRTILLIGFFFGTVNLVYTQTTTIELSKNKVVVGGNTYMLHIVKEKQTLFSISKAYGVSLVDIMKSNGKTEATVNINEVLRIPVNEEKQALAPLIFKKEDDKYVYHFVQKNDTLFSLAKKYGISINSIEKENPGCRQSLPLNSMLRIPKIKQQEKLKVSNVPQNDKKYYYYIIKPGDTQYSIAREFRMKQKKLRKLNPKLKNRVLKPGDWVRIPRYLVSPEYFIVKEDLKDTISEELIVMDTIQKVDKEEIITKSKISVGLFLPLYLKTNDTINQIVSYKDTFEIVMEKEPRTIFRKSREFIRFYQGVLLAVDSLRKEGLSVDLRVFDTERNPEKLRRILSQIQFTDFDYWIGPVYPRTFAVAAEFARMKRIPVISPLSAKNSQINSNPFVIQLNTSLNSICRQISSYVSRDFQYKNIVVVHPERYKHLHEAKLIKDIEYQLFEKGLYWQTDEVSYKKISFDEYGRFGLEATMCDSCENIVVLPSNDQPLVENIITNLNVLSKRFAIRLVGFSKWQRYTSLEADYYYNLNFSLFSPYFIDYKEDKINDFVLKFRDRFLCEPSDFSFRAYDICRFFSLAASRFGTDLMENMNELDVELLQSNYNFKRISAFGGFENRGTHLINYSRDFKIRHQVFKQEESQLEEKDTEDLLEKSFGL